MKTDLDTIETISSYETAWKLVRKSPQTPSTPRVLKLQCAVFAERVPDT